MNETKDFLYLESLQISKIQTRNRKHKLFLDDVLELFEQAFEA